MEDLLSLGVLDKDWANRSRKRWSCYDTDENTQLDLLSAHGDLGGEADEELAIWVNEKPTKILGEGSMGHQRLTPKPPGTPSANSRQAGP